MGKYFGIVVTISLFFPSASSQAKADDGHDIVKKTGITGGLIVHLGCGDGRLTAELCMGDAYLVHGLDTDTDSVSKAREHVQSLGLYGRVSIAQFDGTNLPYADNLVNLVVADDLGQVSMEEIMRALAPLGVAMIAGEKTVKPWPDGIDEWSHFLHGPDNNAVANDKVVGPPRHMQWVAAPKWARSHEQLATISALVTTRGRIFYIVDEGPTASIRLPPKWRLVARDAFNGLLLWKRPISFWEDHTRAFRSGPDHLPRRLVAEGDKVYVTLGFGKPVSECDAATGAILQVYEETSGTQEVICSDGVLYLVVNSALHAATSPVRSPGFSNVLKGTSTRNFPRPNVVIKLMAVQADTGTVLWEKTGPEAQASSLSLTVNRGRLFFHRHGEAVCLDALTGNELWNAKRETGGTPTLVAYGDALVSVDRCSTDKPNRALIVYSALDGQERWSAGGADKGFKSPIDVFVAKGLVWTKNRKEQRALLGHDLRTGEICSTIPIPYENLGMPHHRCYRNKASGDYVLTGIGGIELTNLETGANHVNNWIRGVCQYGVMPANGLIYAPSHACMCYAHAKLNGFWAVAPAQPKERQAKARLEKGPAYGRAADRASPFNDDADWPMYRHDPLRSGHSPIKLSSSLHVAWTKEIGGSGSVKLTQPVVAAGKLFVASVDTHTVYALDGDSGKRLWSYTAGGRIDSSPTLHEAYVLFGSADGWIYCLRQADGQLAWRFRAAPRERMVGAFEQLESTWPVHGSVLLHEGVLYATAGRSSYLDGGISMYRLNPLTGEMLSKTSVYSPDSMTGDQAPMARKSNMEGVLSGVLSCDGELIFMRDVCFDSSGNQVPEESVRAHIFSTTGLLDDTWFHRSFWQYGTEVPKSKGYPYWWPIGNSVPSGRILSFDAKHVFGYGRDRYPGASIGQWRGGEKYHLFATGKTSEAESSPPEVLWSREIPLRAVALATSSDYVVAAGPLDLDKTVDPEYPLRLTNPEATQSAFEGKSGSLLWIASAMTGNKVAEYRLTSPPVHDGMALAAGRVYLSLTNGSIICMSPDQRVGNESLLKKGRLPSPD